MSCQKVFLRESELGMEMKKKRSLAQSTVEFVGGVMILIPLVFF